MLRTIIVEDEPLSRMYLSNLLAEGFPDVEVVGTAATEGEALTIIHAQKPDLVFLDIELQTGTGIRVATQLEACDPAMIFTTALDEHATNLLRITGVPYIQKPIDADTLAVAISAARDKQNCARYSVALGHLRIAMQHGGVPQSLLIAGDAPRYVPIKDVVSVEALDADSRLNLRNGESLFTGHELKELDSLLTQYGFFRTHRAHLINLRYLEHVMRDSALLLDGSEVPLSPKKIAALQACLAAYAVQP